VIHNLIFPSVYSSFNWGIFYL